MIDMAQIGCFFNTPAIVPITSQSAPLNNDMLNLDFTKLCVDWPSPYRYRLSYSRYGGGFGDVIVSWLPSPRSVCMANSKILIFWEVRQTRAVATFPARAFC